MAKMELQELTEKEVDLEDKLSLLLIPKDEADDRDAILEVRAGIGGDEACLFAEEIFRMYRLFASNNGWRFQLTSSYDGPAGGFKEVSAIISGDNVFGKLRWESGGHRVQRVPSTESSGRIHTSAVTVAVLPEVNHTLSLIFMLLCTHS